MRASLNLTSLSWKPFVGRDIRYSQRWWKGYVTEDILGTVGWHLSSTLCGQWLNSRTGFETVLLVIPSGRKPSDTFGEGNFTTPCGVQGMRAAVQSPPPQGVAKKERSVCGRAALPPHASNAEVSAPQLLMNPILAWSIIATLVISEIAFVLWICFHQESDDYDEPAHWH